MSKAKKAVTVVALTTIVQEPGSRGVPPGSLVTLEDPAEAERLVAAGRAAWPPPAGKEKPAPTEEPAPEAPDEKGGDEGALV